MKNKSILTLILLICMGYATTAQTKKEQDIQSIKDMCGCYEVKFKYSETFAPEIDYEKAFDYKASALELALLIEDEENKLSIQHLLVVNDTMVIKHWRQDWLYENTDLYTFYKDKTWNYTTLSKDDVKGQWTQNVYQVDDSPRYSGSATWVHYDGKHYWENKTNAPLPRREYSKRKDYNVMLRGNRQEITDFGWVHEQDNDKVIREDGQEDILLVQEKGLNTYTKVEDSKCKAAADWWKENQKTWKVVRKKWNEILDSKVDLTLNKSVEEKPLFMHLFALDQSKKNKKEVNKIIDSFVSK
ncbi:DUF6607 family protein [Urechidicola croceus]|uniref:Uncharacterized protein n=1 Tax=Urechidicola croceus TaxID=1850246 RepID=A0A1D8P6M1_9FLAO|nr:DUF6607 family protein [Urechidicola croceus]AOW20187.1 hypothetical protein LPB138_05605 [Urechidicola croceus]